MNRTTANVCRIVALVALAVTAVSLAFGQAKDPFGVGYFANANTMGAPDAQLRVTNDGSTGTNLCANIYVFNTDEEMLECCSVSVSPNGYAAIDVNKDLTSQPLTGPPPTRGVIKVVSSEGACAPQSTYSPVGGIRGWLTHIQKGFGAASYSITESDLKDSHLVASELTNLQVTCGFVLTEGSGLAGACSVADSGQ